MRGKKELILSPSDGRFAGKRIGHLINHDPFLKDGGILPIAIFVATAWGPHFGGINSFNQALVKAVAESGRTRVICVVGMGNDDEVHAALTHGIELVVCALEPAEIVAAVRRLIGPLGIAMRSQLPCRELRVGAKGGCRQ